MKTVRLIRHKESFEVRESTFFYFDDDPLRGNVRRRVTSEEALKQAKEFARSRDEEKARTTPEDDAGQV